MARGRSKKGALTCPVCGIDYQDFRTGLKYSDIIELLWTGDDRPETWRYKRRHTCLGKWMQIKREFWEQHINSCDGRTDKIDVVIEGLRFKSKGVVEFEPMRGTAEQKEFADY